MVLSWGFPSPDLHAEVANVRLTALSLVLRPATLPGTAGAAPSIFTLGENSAPFFKNELIARASPSSTHQAEFTLTRDGTLLEYGSFHVSLPAADTNQNRLPDYLEIERAVSIGLTGEGQFVRSRTPTDPGVIGGYGVSGTLTRAAGELTGTYSLVFAGAAGTGFTVRGTWAIHGFDATRSRVTYERTATDAHMNLELFLLEDGSLYRSSRIAVSLTGADTANLGYIVLQNEAGKRVTLSFDTPLVRAGQRYFASPLGSLAVASDLAWIGFTDWALEINDPNDPDENGVPDLTDPFYGYTRVLIDRASTPGSLAVGGRLHLTTTTVQRRPNSYQWFRDGAPILGATTSSLVVDSVQRRPGFQDSAVFAVVTRTDTLATSSASVDVRLTLPPALTANTPRIIPAGALAPVGSVGDIALVGNRAVIAHSNLPEAVRLELDAGSATDEATWLWRANLALPGPASGIALRLSGLSYTHGEIQLIDPVLGELGRARINRVSELEIEDDGFNIRVATEYGRVTVIRASTPTRLGHQFGFVGPPTFDPTHFTSYRTITATAWAAPWLLPRSNARVVNLSTRSSLGNGERALFAGVVLETPLPRALLIRGVGPELRKFGVTDAAAFPSLSVFSGATLLAKNEGWDLAPNASSIALSGTEVGAFPLSAGSRDAAHLQSFGGGAYTFQIGGAGTGLVEVYDVAPPSPGARLANLSTRGPVARGTPLIAGFVITGAGTRTLLIRGIGPALERFGVTDPITDPKLTLYDSGGKIVYENDNWRDLATVSPVEATITAVGAFPLDSGRDPKEAVLFVRLPAGSYSAHVSNVAGQPGLALVELYDVIE